MMNANELFHITKPELEKQLSEKMVLLNKREVSDRIQRGEIETIATQYISEFDTTVENIEKFALSSIMRNWEQGTLTIPRFAGVMITASENTKNGRIVRFAQGTPAFLGFRLLLFGGALALEMEEFNLLEIILQEPIEIRHRNDQYSHLSLIHRSDLFYPDAFLGYADYPILYLSKFWNNHSYIQEFFKSNDNYLISLASVLIVIALATSPKQGQHPLYPGYRLLTSAARSAMSSVCGKMANSSRYLNGIAKAIGDTGDNILSTWSERVKPLNEATLGHEYLPIARVQFPDPINSPVRDW